MLFCSASTSEGGARAHTGTHNGYACLPRSVTYAKVRSLTFQPTVAVLRTCLRPRPAVSIRTTLRPRPGVPIRTTLRPRHSWEINDFPFTCCRSSHLSAPSPQSGKQTTFPYKSLRPWGEGVGKCRRMRGLKTIILCAVICLVRCKMSLQGTD